MNRKLITLIPLLLVFGCSGVKQIGQIGETKYYRINVRGFSGPNITTLVSQKPGEDARIEAAAAGGGIGHTIIASAGHVGASAAFGLSLRPDQTTVEGANSESNASASGTGAAQSNGGGNHNNNHNKTP